MAYDIYVLDESDITISGGEQLDGVNQGDGSHLEGLTITLNTNEWYAVSVSDNDTEFDDNDGNQTLDGAQTIDGVLYVDGTRVEAEYGLTLTDGVNTWTVVGFNVNNSSPAFGTIEGLAFIGGPGGFPPVGVPLTVSGSFEGPAFESTEYAVPICFVAGTMIETRTGKKRVEDLRAGDLVSTLNNGPQVVRWVSQTTHPAIGELAPIRFEKGAIGNKRPLQVSPQHRMAVTDWQAELWFRNDGVLVPAKSFVNGISITQVFGGMVTYCHFMCDQHELVMSEGVVSESYHPGQMGVNNMTCETREELYALFPRLERDFGVYGPSALPDVRGPETAILARS